MYQKSSNDNFNLEIMSILLTFLSILILIAKLFLLSLIKTLSLIGKFYLTKIFFIDLLFYHHPITVFENFALKKFSIEII
jgi:hypothetical protein